MGGFKMTGLSGALWIAGSYIIAGLIFYFLINFLTKGFISQYLKVKISRGKLILVKCYDITDTFYKAGKIDTRRNLVIKDRQGKVHTFGNMETSYIGRELGMNVVEVDLVKGLVNKEYKIEVITFNKPVLDNIKMFGPSYEHINFNGNVQFIHEKIRRYIKKNNFRFH